MSAYIVSKEHIDYLITAGLQAREYGSDLRWLLPAQIPEAAYQRGAPWGAEAQESFEERVRYLKADTANEVGRLLWSTNQESVNHRYDGSELEEVYFYSPSKHYEQTHHIDPVQVLKAISCYEYQSCEHPEWERSEAFAFCDSLRGRMIHILPGYEEAEWGEPLLIEREA